MGRKMRAGRGLAARMLAGMGILAMAASGADLRAEEESILNFYNWNDYIAPGVIEDFEKETGIKVRYDLFDSNEVLESKLLAGHTDYDLVVPTGGFLERQIQAGVFRPLDKDKLPNLANMDEGLMARAAEHDPGNRHALIYMWGTSGLGIVTNKLREVLGDAQPFDTWDLIFKPELAEKVSTCGLSVLDAPTETIEIGLNYLGLNPYTASKVDHKTLERMLMKVRPHITRFNSGEVPSMLANGDVCVAMGWSGDVLQARDRAMEAGNNVIVDYVVPREGSVVWFDMIAIPADAPHPDNAHKFLNYLMRPEVAAAITNYVQYANANQASWSLVDPEIRNDPRIFPDDAMRERLFPERAVDPRTERLRTRLWNRLKTGH